MIWVRNLRDFHDFIGYVILSAPDDFPKENYLPAEEQMTFKQAFEELHTGLGFVDEKSVGHARKAEMKKMLIDAQQAYVSGDLTEGIDLLARLQKLIPKR
jgi:hypothetical protein